jgi:hypothetical protein
MEGKIEVKVLTLIVLLLAANSARAIDFVLVNVTGYTIVQVNLTPEGAAGWQHSVLLTKLSSGGERSIHIDDPSRTRIWNLQIVFKGGNKVTWSDPGFGLSRIHRITLEAKGAKVNAHWEQ